MTKNLKKKGGEGGVELTDRLDERETLQESTL